MKLSHPNMFAGAAALSALVGCAAQQSSSGAPAATTTAETAEAPVVPPPEGSPLSKVKIGMTTQDVMNVLGAPTSQTNYTTGKTFIPFYFGTDARRASYFYKGMGRVVFATGNAFGAGGEGEVIRVEYDPAETGVAR